MRSTSRLWLAQEHASSRTFPVLQKSDAMLRVLRRKHLLRGSTVLSYCVLPPVHFGQDLVYSGITKNSGKKNLDQFLTLDLDQFLTPPNLGPVFNSTAYIYIYIYICVCFYTPLSLSLVCLKSLGNLCYLVFIPLSPLRVSAFQHLSLSLSFPHSHSQSRFLSQIPILVFSFFCSLFLSFLSLSLISLLPFL